MVVCPGLPALASSRTKRNGSSNLRNLYRYLPFARSTYRHAAAIIAASSQTYSEFAAYSDKLFFVPEPGIGRSLCFGDSRSPEPGAKLELIFVGGLVPRKACDLALRAAAPLLRSDLAHFTVVGDGPERNRLEQLTSRLGSRRPFPSAAGSAMRKSSGTSDLPMYSCSHLFATTVQA